MDRCPPIWGPSHHSLHWGLQSRRLQARGCIGGHLFWICRTKPLPFKKRYIEDLSIFCWKRAPGATFGSARRREEVICFQSILRTYLYPIRLLFFWEVYVFDIARKPRCPTNPHLSSDASFHTSRFESKTKLLRIGFAWWANS